MGVKDDERRELAGRLGLRPSDIFNREEAAARVGVHKNVWSNPDGKGTSPDHYAKGRQKLFTKEILDENPRKNWTGKTLTWPAETPNDPRRNIRDLVRNAGLDDPDYERELNGE